MVFLADEEQFQMAIGWYVREGNGKPLTTSWNEYITLRKVALR